MATGAVRRGRNQVQRGAGESVTAVRQGQRRLRVGRQDKKEGAESAVQSENQWEEKKNSSPHTAVLVLSPPLFSASGEAKKKRW